MFVLAALQLIHQILYQIVQSLVEVIINGLDNLKPLLDIRLLQAIHMLLHHQWLKVLFLLGMVFLL